MRGIPSREIRASEHMTSDGVSAPQIRKIERVPTANPTLVTIACESADHRCDEGLLQLDLVRSGRPVPVAGGAASRNPGVLRHQLNVLRRKSPRRVALGNFDPRSRAATGSTALRGNFLCAVKAQDQDFGSRVLREYRKAIKGQKAKQPEQCRQAGIGRAALQLGNCSQGIDATRVLFSPVGRKGALHQTSRADFDSAIRRFESSRPSQPVRSPPKLHCDPLTTPAGFFQKTINTGRLVPTVTVGPFTFLKPPGTR